MRVALYARVSTQRQQQSQSIEQQVERLKAQVRSQGWLLETDHIYLDDGYSGAKLARPGLDRLRDHAALAEFDIVLVSAPDRLARNYVQQMLLFEELKQRNIQLDFLERPMNDDPHDQLLLQIRGAVAEYERTLIADRMRRGRLNKMKAGKLLPWIRIPYGYRVDPEHPRDPQGVYIDKAEAAILVQMFEDYLAPKASLSSVAKRLTEQGIPTPAGKLRWISSMVRRLLCNTAYTGILYGNRLQRTEASRRHSALQVQPAGDSLKARPASDWIAIPVPVIIDQALFDKVQHKLSSNRQQASRNNKKHNYLLRGLLSCGLCRLASHARTVHEKYHYYVCRGHSDRLRYAAGHRCSSRFIPALALDDLVWLDLCNLLSHPESIAHALERAHGGHWLPQQLQARLQKLSQALDHLALQRQRLLDAYLAQLLELDEFEQKRASLDAKRMALESQRQQLEATATQRLELSSLGHNIDSFCQDIRTSLNQADFSQKRHLVELLIDRVIVLDENVEIRYVIPTSTEASKHPFSHLCIDYRNHQ